jgi:hypothetical protein
LRQLKKKKKNFQSPKFTVVIQVMRLIYCWNRICFQVQNLPMWESYFVVVRVLWHLP